MKAKPPKEKGEGAIRTPPASNRTKNHYVTKFRPPAPWPHQLCAWRIGQGQFWFQTTRSDLARKLARRRDTRRVEVSGLNHSRRTFEIWGTRRKVRRIIKRF